MAFIDSAGVRLHTRTLGAGPLLVMVHGLISGSMASWFFSAAAALARHYTVVLYDQRGHGKSEMPCDGYDLAGMARDLGAVIAASTVGRDSNEQLCLVGFSYGALIALQYALEHPAQIARLSLIDPPLPASRYIAPSLEQLACAPELASLPAKGRSRAGAAGQRERLAFLLLTSSLRRDVHAGADLSDAQLRTLAMPMQCIAGTRSDCKEASLRLASLLPQLGIEWIACGHDIVSEAPGEMTRALCAFFQTETP